MSTRRITVTAALVVAASATAVVASAPAQAAGVVPNMFDCSRLTLQCHQTNGPHVPNILDSCRWVWFVSAPTTTTAVCDTWR